MTLNAAALLLAGHDPARCALACGDARMTYGELVRAVARAASAWRDLGVGPGDPVALQVPDGIDSVVAGLGAIWAGGVAVFVNSRVPTDEWTFMLGQAGFRALLVESPDAVPEPWRDAALTLDAWRLRQAAAEPVPPLRVPEDTPALWTHSSGTTGRPKAVVHAHRFAQAIERVAAERLHVTPDDRLYASSKLFFAYPLANAVFAGLKLGATVVLDPAWPSAESVAATLAAQRPTVLFSVPALYRDLLARGLAPRAGTHALRLCVSAGEALHADLRAAWERATGVPLVDGWGASETLGLALVDLDGQGLAPSPGVTVEPVGACDAERPTRLVVAGPTLALGYWKRPEADAEAFRDGRFCPADLFVAAPPDRWRFAGREDCLVKVRGRWVDLVALAEGLASACPAVAEAAAVAVPDRDGVAEVALFYALRPGAPADAAPALRAAAERLPAHQRPRWLRALPALPRTATGKLLRRRLVDMPVR